MIPFEYELLDVGEGRRCERFGDLILDRPCPAAMLPQKIKWPVTDATFIREKTGGFWKFSRKLPESWPIKIGKFTAELRFSANGQIGIFPEQFEIWNWVSEKIRHENRPLKILNGFAYTGIGTLFLSDEKNEVVHLDGAKSAINWAKKNAECSGCFEQKIRWICDDVLKFMHREIRRDQKYDAIILDPPAFGRGPGGEFEIGRDAPKLFSAANELLSENPAFVIFTCHAPDLFSAEDFAGFLQKFSKFHRKKAEPFRLEIPSACGNPLLSSFGARIEQ